MLYPFPWPQTLALCAALLAAYIVTLALYRLYFSRISHIPGPRLAALTYFYQFYYDVFPHSGQFMFEYGRLHEQYGPVIRIGPDEVHVKDNALYNEIYTQGNRRRDKSRLWFYHEEAPKVAGQSAWTTIDHDVHRMRRGAFSQYFSRAKVLELQPRISAKVELLRERVLAWEGSGELLDLYVAFSGSTLEVITEYVFGRSVSVLRESDLGTRYARMARDANRIHAVARHFPTIMRQLLQLPDWVMVMSGSKMFQTVKSLNDALDACTEQAFDEAVQQKDKQSITVLHEMVESKSLPPEEKALERLKQDAIVFVLAGMETTARTISVVFYYILKNPDVRKRLEEELRPVLPTASSPIPRLSELEKLPYLTAVINEANRLADGVAGRLARVAPDEDLVCHGYKIPRGVTISQSHYYVHRDPEVFLKPLEFHPERFLKDGFEGIGAAEAQKNVVPFSKGARMCVGMNLAWAELYLTVAVLLTSVRMELVDTTDQDVTVVEEHFIGMFPEDSKGIRVKVLGRA